MSSVKNWFFRHLNMLAFAKILKKFDKVSFNAWLISLSELEVYLVCACQELVTSWLFQVTEKQILPIYLKVVESSYFNSSDKVCNLLSRETTHKYLVRAYVLCIAMLNMYALYYVLPMFRFWHISSEYISTMPSGQNFISAQYMPLRFTWTSWDMVVWNELWLYEQY